MTSLKDFIKQKRDEVAGELNDENVQFMYISSVTPPSSTPVSTQIVKSEEIIQIICDGGELSLPFATARKSKFIANILANGSGSEVKYKESQENIVRLPQFKSDVLEEIFRFCAQDVLINPSNDDDEQQNDTYTTTRKPRVSFMFTLNPALVIEVIITAHFLVIPPLVSIAIKYIAEYVDVDDVSILSTLPPDVLFQVYCNFTPQQLAKIESTPAHKALDFDTSEVWKLLCEKQGWIIINNTSTDWKVIFFEQQLRCALITWNDTESDIQTLYDLLSTSAPFIHKLYINRMSPSWESYIHLLPNLVHLEIYENRLHEDGRCQRLVHIIQSKLPNLESLTLVDCNIDDECLGTIAPLLLAPTSHISKVDLSQNFISQEGAEKLAENVKSCCNSTPLVIILSFNNVKPGPPQEKGVPKLSDIDFGTNTQCIITYDRSFLQRNLPHRVA